ncbi:putative 6-aminohexanoate-dimer hydrolase domain protein [Mycobacterium kansasii 824]|uniref:Putative 6-aminohexanoate-dimer hydrolase domain protein n=1 Tax=Mycobacterium kansasii TaxID=1768 RepID=A0A1V3XDL8_MYCKA|nr:putative 6-aminohexanoate-dimer hydrolase domain protein [Mycobacterium kansasii 824]OOK77313.1 putative 6-aminohexanoate-dimer hydrolase domain protein [Mycobacterium kansasii]
MSSGRCGEPGRVPAGISLDNWLSPPHSHWSFQHIEDFMPTAVIPRGRGRPWRCPWRVLRLPTSR